ncbi:hypothetical protein TL16_g11899 [Triparma laevis f. inornata]|uniref:Uncharacterized protein n=1 Tax=Triparma laevis f. inornata TaxID=1714386 RepID=A0A9W7BI64_9STRA|nr:hypothetical protein TL16_g11899 [Triparma laevis f. inornata]
MFLSKWYHAKNKNNPLPPRRQKQVSTELSRILRSGSSPLPFPSKIHFQIDVGQCKNMLIFHHHHHLALKWVLPSENFGGGPIWIWEDWETSTDERVMKAVILELLDLPNSSTLDSPLDLAISKATEKTTETVVKQSSKDVKRLKALEAAEKRKRKDDEETNEGSNGKRKKENKPIPNDAEIIEII